MVVALGNLFANLWQIGSAGEAVTDVPLAERLGERLRLPPPQVAAVRDRVREDIEKARIFLKVSH